jgi:hypothetical protein
MPASGARPSRSRQPEKVTTSTGVSWMNIKDLLTITLSLIALMISGVNFYITNFMINNEVIARISEISARGGNVQAQVVLVNRGNRQAVISKIRYETGASVNLQSGQNFFDPPAALDALPFVISPQEVRVIELHLPIQSLSESGVSYAGLRFITFNALGESFDVWSGMQIHARRHDGRLEEVKQVEGAKQYIPLMR